MQCCSAVIQQTCNFMHGPDLCLDTGGGGSFWGCLRTGQPTHPSKLAHPPTHPPRTPPTPPVGGGGGVLSSYIPCPLHTENSIAFGSAPRREAESQPISQLARPAVSQTETHSLGVLSIADSVPSSGANLRPQGKFWPSGNAAYRRLFGRRFKSRSGEHRGAAPPTTVDRPGFEPPT